MRTALGRGLQGQQQPLEHGSAARPLQATAQKTEGSHTPHFHSRLQGVWKKAQLP